MGSIEQARANNTYNAFITSNAEIQKTVLLLLGADHKTQNEIAKLVKGKTAPEIVKIVNEFFYK